MKTLCIIIMMIFLANSFGQKNAVFLEIAGNAQGSSLNYERQLSEQKGLMFRIGVGGALVEEEMSSNFFDDIFPVPKFSLPISLEYLIHIKNQNYVETGIGYTWIDINKTYTSTERGRHNLILAFGFRRYFGKQKTWIWKANFSPILAGNGNSGLEFGFSPMFGIALGKGF